jgi:hypothetical protein
MTSLSARATAAIPDTFGGYTIKKRLTFQQIKIVTGVDYVFRVVSACYEGHDNKPAEGAEVVASGVAPRKPPTLMQVIMLNDDNKLGVIVCPKGVTDKFAEEFEDDDYVGRVFGLRLLGKRVAKNGNNFNDLDFNELHADEPEEQAVEPVKAVSKRAAKA